MEIYYITFPIPKNQAMFWINLIINNGGLPTIQKEIK